jgi:hypothetical protein
MEDRADVPFDTLRALAEAAACDLLAIASDKFITRA